MVQRNTSAQKQIFWFQKITKFIARYFLAEFEVSMYISNYVQSWCLFIITKRPRVNYNIILELKFYSVYIYVIVEPMALWWFCQIGIKDWKCNLITNELSSEPLIKDGMKFVNSPYSVSIYHLNQKCTYHFRDQGSIL